MPFFSTTWNTFKGRTENKRVWNTVFFDLNPDVVVIQHSVYNLLDFLRDVGGLVGILIVITSFFNEVFSFNKLENWLVSELYMKPKTSTGKGNKEPKELDAGG